MLLSLSVERFGVSSMRDFFLLFNTCIFALLKNPDLLNKKTTSRTLHWGIKGNILMGVWDTHKLIERAEAKYIYIYFISFILECTAFMRTIVNWNLCLDSWKPWSFSKRVNFAKKCFFSGRFCSQRSWPSVFFMTFIRPIVARAGLLTCNNFHLFFSPEVNLSGC